MPKLITFASQKGGVGKTTSAVNLASSLTLAGRKTLLFDLDPQGNASSGVGFARDQLDLLEDHALTAAAAGEALTSCVQSTPFPRLHTVCSAADLSSLGLLQKAQGAGREVVRDRIREIAQDYDYVLFDCPPSLGGLPTIALACSDQVFVPIQCEYFAMEGLSQILPLIQELQSDINPDLEIGGLLLTMFSEDLDLSHEVRREVRGYFGEAVFRTVIPRDVVLAEASSHGLPAYHYAPLSRGAWSYIELAREVLSDERA